MIDYLEQGRTINGAYNGDLLRQEIKRKRLGKQTCGALLLQDNTLPTRHKLP